MRECDAEQFFVPASGLALGAGLVFAQAPAIVTSDRARPLIDAGVSAGPSGRDGAIVWAHADRPARLTVEYSTTSSFTNRSARARHHRHARHRTDGARRDRRSAPRPGRLLSRALRRRGERAHRQRAAVTATSARRRRRAGPFASRGRRMSAARAGASIRSRGGMRLFETMADANPDLFVHVGDTIYADGPLARRSDAGRRHDVAEHRDAGQVEGGGDARRVPRQSSLQPARRALPPLCSARSATS